MSIGQLREYLVNAEQNVARLPTTWLLLYINEKVTPRQTYSAANGVAFTVSNSRPSASRGISAPLPNRWQSLFPGPVDYGPFSIVGHCLFALLAGLLGMIIARWYQARQDSVRADE